MTNAPLLAPIDAAPQLRRGAVLAYPTEAVWGLGCDPFDEAAVLRLLALKDRPVDKGLILIAAARSQLDGLLDWDRVPAARRNEIDASWPGPNTWVVPATARVPRWISGVHAGVAVRVSAHPVVIALCNAFGGALVSTSANPAGAPAPSTLSSLDPDLRTRLDGIVEGETGGLDRPTVIRDALSGAALRL
ncbi:Sua5/YciO/YrdC/YwlC family protein [Cognatilysobacter bugurensis]|uniref:Threonylcarbamoyl-AMP synthase n=1 Tax=Cognatilysobacter bugurensis TaxID=543356 RepID=A0A918T1J8_9GAMM|nr:Sua5/YciO/YrdC/YwlC family protein [Lysobacter bugurensis]GHA82572.1 threonylcarbamoyl-AMP synthase [Lysobacter bugurensis]